MCHCPLVLSQNQRDESDKPWGILRLKTSPKMGQERWNIVRDKNLDLWWEKSDQDMEKVWVNWLNTQDQPGMWPQG
jgi:hypothetical protein